MIRGGSTSLSRVMSVAPKRLLSTHHSLPILGFRTTYGDSSLSFMALSFYRHLMDQACIPTLFCKMLFLVATTHPSWMLRLAPEHGTYKHLRITSKEPLRKIGKPRACHWVFGYLDCRNTTAKSLDSGRPRLYSR